MTKTTTKEKNDTMTQFVSEIRYCFSIHLSTKPIVSNKKPFLFVIKTLKQENWMLFFAEIYMNDN